MADIQTWGWYVPSLWPGYSASDPDNLDAIGNGLSVDPAGYVEFIMRDANNDGVIHDNDGFDGSSTAPGEVVIGPNVTLTPQEIALYTDSTIVAKGVTYTVDIEVTLFTNGTYGVRIMDYDIPDFHHKHVTEVTLGTWNGVEYGGIYTSGVDEMFICFGQGTLIDTADGPRAVEDLQNGDMVLTLDHGPSTVRWTSRRTISGQGKNAPVLFRAGAMGNVRDVYLSPQYRVLVTGVDVELIFGVPEVLVAAAQLVNSSTIVRAPQPTVTYVHFACDEHEIVCAEGMLSETLLPGPQAMQAIAPKDLARLFQTFPALRQGWNSYGSAARMCLTAAEARALRDVARGLAMAS